MAKLLKCKICGDTEFTEIGELLQCRSCKHKTPKPKENAELLERANNIRFETKSFDEAAALYEEIIRIMPDEAEAYWGRALCRYGIEYVKDNDGKYLPTCHRTIEGSILDDADYKMAVLKAERGMAEYYMSEAGTIDEYQKKIKLIAAKEEPYDVFISFKATDDLGRPTEDSLLAQELYYYLTKNLGLKVFFSNITLRDKAGQEYEPIIYAALSSATVMLLVGTKPEYINATWVKNEWSRYAKMVVAARQKNKSKYIVTALKGMEPEQLPSVLATYQAVNLSELGAKEKLCSNIDSLIGDLRIQSQKTPAAGVGIDANDMLSAEAANLCNLGFQQLTLRDFNKAGEYFQKAIEKKSDTALAHWGMLLSSQQVAGDEELADKRFDIKANPYYKLAIQCASAEEKMRFDRVDSLIEVSLRREGEIICNSGFEKLRNGDFEEADAIFVQALSIKSDISLAFWGRFLVSENVCSDEEAATHIIDVQKNEFFKAALDCASESEKKRYDIVTSQISSLCDSKAQEELKKAEEYIRDGKYSYAETCILKAIELKEDIPARYYWQLIRIFAGASDDEMLSQIAYPVKDDIFYERAMKYATSNEAEQYKRIAEMCQKQYDMISDLNSSSFMYLRDSRDAHPNIAKKNTERGKFLYELATNVVLYWNYKNASDKARFDKKSVYSNFKPEYILDKYMLKYISQIIPQAYTYKKEPYTRTSPMTNSKNVSLYLKNAGRYGYTSSVKNKLKELLGISDNQVEEIIQKAPCYIAHNVSIEKAREAFIELSDKGAVVFIHSRPLDDIIQSYTVSENSDERVSVYLTDIGWLFGGDVRKILQNSCGMDKDKAKSVSKNLPACIATNIPLSQAKELVEAIASKYSVAEIRMQ